MKRASVCISICSALLSVTGCNQSSSPAKVTSPHAPSSIVVLSQNDLSEWDVTPHFDTSKNGSPIVDVDVQYKGTSVPAESATISLGDGKTQLKEMKNSAHIVIGTSYGNSTQLTLNVSWKEGNQSMQGKEVLSLR